MAERHVATIQPCPIHWRIVNTTKSTIHPGKIVPNIDDGRQLKVAANSKFPAINERPNPTRVAVLPAHGAKRPAKIVERQ
jgi:hypothetical protein